MMKRVLSEYLVKTPSGLYFDGELYSGVVYFVDTAGSVASREVKDGALGNEYYVCELVGPYNGELRIDLWNRIDDYEFPDYMGKGYTGFSYRFDDGYCLRESKLVDGLLESDVHWDMQGNLVEYMAMHSGLSEAYKVVLDKVVQYKFMMMDSFSGYVEFSEDYISGISSTGGFIDSLGFVSDKSKLFAIRDFSEITSMRSGRAIKIIGSDFDDNIFRRMCASGFFENCIEIILSYVAISESMMQYLEHEMLLKIVVRE